MSKVAILVDGGFYRKRARHLFGETDGAAAADQMYDYVRRHLKHGDELYRIFYYDCPPIEKQVYHPLLKRAINFQRTPQYTWMTAFLERVCCKRKLALRMGQLSDTQTYNLKPKAVKDLCSGKITLDDLTEADFILDAKQKGVDMMIGVDIASMAFKRQVDRIVLIAGDSDFVPAAKLARREGIDFVLDPLWATITPSLNEHIDGIYTWCAKPISKKENTPTEQID